MLPVKLNISFADNCGAAGGCKIIAVSSNEPVIGSDNGDRAPDWEITGDLTLNLRAERSGRANGRTYTVTVQCSDSAGRTVTKAVLVTVPHDQTEK